ncbi:hypothetical protein O3G_MSEX006832 [Manduca sexta]|uniref:C2H2-type domain-containing protein n=2 Tax=Manduca sexta TaxID=7130 RepID=A0A921Z4Y1_MANSE|nr:hypothetical protein O3G_MSEX006832 [Manduca sexta]
MAGNKIHKTKGKEDKNKGNKGKGQSNVSGDDPDHALLRKPVLTSITGFSQARKIYDWATEELKHILAHECDILYECKVCRNIFRSLANFISHKRVYCKETFNPNEHGHFMKPPSTFNELLKIKRLEEEYQESLKENKEENATIKEDERIPLTKDLTEIVEKINKKNGMQNGHSDSQMILQEIPNSSVAVFQNVNTSEEKQNESMQKQVIELDNILSKSLAVLQRDGNCKLKVLNQDPDSVIQISDDDDDENGDTNDILKCKSCDLQFSTQKTLKFHMKYKHVESRLVYPCPDCLEIFSTSWSVYRHLFKVHRKTAAQIRRLRESIQLKAFRMNNIPAFYEKRRNVAKHATSTRKVTEEERLDQENQAWIDNMEGDGEGPRCGGCGRAFERRAALVAHTHTCASRSRARALAAARRHDAKRIQIQIRRDYHKEPAAPPAPPGPASPPSPLDNDDNEIEEESRPAPESVKNSAMVSPVLVDDTDDPVELGEHEEKSDIDSKSADTPETRSQESASMPDEVLVVPDDTTPEGVPVIQVDPEESETGVLQDVTVLRDIPTPIIRLPHARNAEKSNLNAFREKIEPDVELETYLCKKCGSKSSNIQELYDHMAAHYKWMRYACKLCNFKHYIFEKLPEHVKVVHKLKGDKDFYFSTVKALDGPEALELAEVTSEQNVVNGNSPDSQRGSRCSSDSSRLSDEGSSSTTLSENNVKKRKKLHNTGSSKRKKTSPSKTIEDPSTENQGTPSDKEVNLIEIDSNSSNIKPVEENSSDMDDVDDKVSKRQLVEDTTSMASRRPVRRKTKPKNEDFEYDLSNLLKLEAQGYYQVSTTAKSNNTKKKYVQENQITYESLNRDCCGAMVALSKNAVERSAAHMKMKSFSVCLSTREPRHSGLFLRPMLPKSTIKGEKTSPKKDSLEEKRDDSSPNKEVKNQIVSEELPKSTNKEKVEVNEANKGSGDGSAINKNQINKSAFYEAVKTNLGKTPVVPLKLRRESLEVIKNPLINKNIKDFKKAGLTTKILVIKPFKRDSDGLKGLNTPVQYQTIKVKDSKKDSSSEDKSSYQKVVVEVPIVDNAVARTSADPNVGGKVSPITSDAAMESSSTAAEDTSEHVNTLTPSDVKEEKICTKSSTSVIVLNSVSNLIK